jgi:hypothetical protein
MENDRPAKTRCEPRLSATVGGFRRGGGAGAGVRAGVGVGDNVCRTECAAAVACLEERGAAVNAPDTHNAAPAKTAATAQPIAAGDHDRDRTAIADEGLRTAGCRGPLGFPSEGTIGSFGWPRVHHCARVGASVRVPQRPQTPGAASDSCPQVAQRH